MAADHDPQLTSLGLALQLAAVINLPALIEVVADAAFERGEITATWAIVIAAMGVVVMLQLLAGVALAAGHRSAPRLLAAYVITAFAAAAYMFVLLTVADANAACTSRLWFSS